MKTSGRNGWTVIIFYSYGWPFNPLLQTSTASIFRLAIIPSEGTSTQEETGSDVVTRDHWFSIKFSNLYYWVKPQMAAQVTGVTGNAKVDLQFHFQGRGFTSASPKRGKQFKVKPESLHKLSDGWKLNPQRGSLVLWGYVSKFRLMLMQTHVVLVLVCLSCLFYGFICSYRLMYLSGYLLLHCEQTQLLLHLCLSKIKILEAFL